MVTYRSLAVLLAGVMACSLMGCDKVKLAGRKFGQLIREGSEASSKASEAVERFHKMYDEGQYAAIYSEVDARFQKAQPEEAFVTLLTSVKERLGNVTSATPSGWKLNTNDGSITAILTYTMKYERGEGTETFRLEGTAEKMEILAWNINSDQLK